MDRVGRFQVFIDGTEIDFILSLNLQRAMEQEFSTLEIVLPQPMPAFIHKWSRILAVIGVDDDDYVERFTGFVLDINEAYYPGRESLRCGDTLALCRDFYPLTDITFVGLTDEEIVVRVLQEVGVPDDMMVITGTGKRITDNAGLTGSPAVTWPFVESALDVIKEMDSISVAADRSGAYRTFCDPSGVIRRLLVKEFPGEVAAYTFTENVDILTGATSSFIEKDPKTEVNILAQNGTGSAIDPDNPNTWRQNAWWDEYKRLVEASTSVDFLNAEDQAAWVFARLNRNIVTVSLPTFRSMVLNTVMTIAVNSPNRLRVNQNFWLQSHNLTVTNKGVLRQTLGLISEWDFSQLGVNSPFGPLIPPGTPLTPVIPIHIAPTPFDLIPSISVVGIDREIVLVAGVPTTLYIVSCVDLSLSLQGTIASRAWTASGTGVITASGSQREFTTGFTDLTAASISLTITDSNGNSGTVTRVITATGVPVQARKLYAATATTIEAFDGTNWRSYTPSNSAPITAIGHGPLWAAGSLVLHTADDLATPAIEATAFDVSTEVDAVWVEPDVTLANVAAGAIDGRTAYSLNAGTSFTAYAGPGGSPVRAIIISRFVRGQMHAITNEGYFVSDNNGSSWRLILSGDFVDMQLAPARNVLVTSSGVMVLAAAVTELFTFPGTPHIVCATAHIRRDIFYAMASDGSTYSSTAPGSYAMTRREDIPLGTPQVRGMYRDGVMIDVVYFAAGNGGLWKTSNGFMTTEGFHQLRAGTI